MSKVCISCKVCLLDFQVSGAAATGVVKCLEHLYVEMKEFSRSRNLYLHMAALTRNILDWPTHSDFPCGFSECSSNSFRFWFSRTRTHTPMYVSQTKILPRQWFKGADTTFVLKFLVFKYSAVLSTADLGDAAGFFETILSCLKASDDFLSALYRAGLFLGRRRLNKIVKHGQVMLATYARIAGQAHARALARFKYNPKYHMLMHVVHQLQEEYNHGLMPINSLAFSCQMPEDFINRISTLTRSVAAKHLHQRTLDLYQTCVARAW